MNINTQKITPFLWYENGDALAVAKYYKEIFKDNVEIVDESELDNTPSGNVSVVTIKIFGLTMRIMSAGKHHSFNDSISFEIKCKDQTEIDLYWDKIIKEGSEQQCGWCIDKYGLRWQIIPDNLGEYLGQEGGMEKMLKMKKIVIEDFK